MGSCTRGRSQRGQGRAEVADRRDGAWHRLGEAFLIWSGEDDIADSSEHGHADFGPTNPTQVGLLEFLTARSLCGCTPPRS
jgi:glucokinase